MKRRKERNYAKVRLVKAIPLDERILTIRGLKVILDADLAEIYAVTTKRLNEQVKRNRDRFPPDFCFQLTQTETSEVVANCDHLNRLKFSPVLPRAFIKMRSAFGESRELTGKLALLEQELKIRLNIHEAAIVDVLQRIMKILDPPLPPPEPPRPEMGFHVKEANVPYRTKRKTLRN